MIKKYKTFIKEDKDEDVPAYMRDELDDYTDEGTFDDYSDYTEEYDDYEEDDEEQASEMENLVYWIRTLFSNSGVEAHVEVDKLDITIVIELGKTSSLREMIKILDITRKLSKDILPQYTSKMSMFETRKRKNLLVFDFYYEEYDEEDELPFD